MRKKQLLRQNELLLKKLEEADGVIADLNAHIGKKDDEIKTLNIQINDLLKQIEYFGTKAVTVSETEDLNDIEVTDNNPNDSAENNVSEEISAITKEDVSDGITDDYVHEFAVDKISKIILKTTKAAYRSNIDDSSAILIKGKCECTKETILGILMSNQANDKKIEEIKNQYNDLLAYIN